jgi:hypothetical protein
LARTVLLSTPNSLASSYTRTFATALPTGSEVSTADRRYLFPLIVADSSLRAHRALIAISTCPDSTSLTMPDRRPVTFLRYFSYLPTTSTRLQCPNILPEHAQIERSLASRRQPKSPRERPTALSQLKTSRAGVQGGSPARQPPTGIGEHRVPHHHQAKQVRLGRTVSAAHTGTQRDRPASCHRYYRVGVSGEPGGVSDDP